MRLLTWILLAMLGSGLVGCATGGSAPPQDGSILGLGLASKRQPSRRRSLGASFGFSADPSAPLAAFEIMYALRDGWSLGPQAQFAMDDKLFLFAPALHVKKSWAFTDPGITGWSLSLQGGPGFAFLDKDNQNGDDDEVGLMLNIGAGLDYRLNEDLTLGTNMLLHFMPGGVLDEHSFFTWELLVFRFSF